LSSPTALSKVLGFYSSRQAGRQLYDASLQSLILTAFLFVFFFQ